MQTFSRKNVAITLAIAGIVAVSLIFTTSCTDKKPVTFIDPAFGEFITTYTAGIVSSGSAVRIVLAGDAVDSSAIGQESTVKLFSFSPSVGGKTFWLDRRTVEFRPDTRLKSGQVYHVSFSLSKLREVPDGLGVFEYTLQVIPQNFEVSIQNVKAYQKNLLTRQKVEGVLYTADFATEDQVEKMMQAEQDGKALKVSWAHAGEGKQHDFTIEDVTRKDEADQVNVAVKGVSLDISQSQQLDIPVPALRDFKVTNIKVDQSSAQHVVIQFSDPLDEKQNLEGLLNINDVGTLDFEIDDNEIKVYPSVRQTGAKSITLSGSIRNALDHSLKADTTMEVIFEQLNPAVRFTGKGSVLPGTDGLIIPFEAVNLKAVDVQIIKIFEKNVLQFFQANDYDGSEELRRVGRLVVKKNQSLENFGISDLGKWNRFTLDLSKLINTEPGAIYQIRISFKKSYLAYPCDDGEDAANAASNTPVEEWDQEEGDASSWDSYEEYYYSEDYDWEQRDNPCNSSYYSSNRNIQKNVLASDIGLLAKRGGDGNTRVFVNDLKTTEPLPGVTLELYDYQQQLIGTASTGSDGQAIVSSKGTPYILLAKKDSQRGYLKVSDGQSLSISNFDVSGERVEKGLKGFLYGERGVWRPGDSLYLTFILEDKLKQLPTAHPVVFELQNPQGQIASRIVRSASENGFYKFATATSPDATTGNWKASVKVGGAEFDQPIKIETVKPNRLKINLDFGVTKLTAGTNNIKGDLQVNWLHGAPGRNLKAEFEVILTKAETKFQRYPDFVFDDPSRDFSSEAQTIFEGYTDEKGHATIETTLETTSAAPGMLNAIFRGKAFEESGNFSIDRFSIPYYPFVSFTGLRLPPGDKARGMLLTDTTHRADVVTVDADGNPVSREKIEMTLYKLEWRWWWNNDGNDANYMTSAYAEPLVKGTTRTVNGKGSWNFKIKYPEWGRYLIKAFDPVSGHTTGKVVYIDWPGWAGRSKGGNEGATMLSFTSDKPSYSIGDKATLVIPGSDQGRALVSIENGSTVLKTSWVKTKKGETSYTFDVTREMTPNVFAHVTLIQPHAQTTNDLPIRLYGVIPIKVEDPGTHLTPVIAMPDVLEPGKEVLIKISEQANRAMTYTVAVVDEGLLDLTRFKTPDAWNRFYAREALGVKTWDLYDDVIGAYGAHLERLLAIGGDAESATSKEDDPRANRFKPVVKFLGPFTIKSGSKEHRFVMPEYIGSVKTMVVAGYGGAYGKTEKATPVRKPLMVLATLPRVLGPEEKVRLPVTLFTMDKNIKNVQVDIQATGPVEVKQNSQAVVMTGADMTIDFELSVKNGTGIGKIKVKATSGSYSSTDEIEIEIRNPNPPVSKVDEAILEAGKTWSQPITAIGMPGTNSAVLEVSSLPPINLGQRMRYLLQYPYGCIEQTTSAVFPQLYVDQIKSMTEGEKTAVQRNVKAGIERLQLFITKDGGFSYWPGNEDSDSWATTYAGHFLLEAEARGYLVPSDMMKRWKKFERNRAQSWRQGGEGFNADLVQAYRLYALSLSGDPELGPMNRLREEKNMSTAASWMLAAAYLKAGQPEAGRKIIDNLATSIKPYQEMGYTYGSDLRDKAIILETLVLLNNRVKGFDLLKDISAALSNESTWMSTQTVAWCLNSVAGFTQSEKKGPLKFSYAYNGKSIKAQTDLPFAQVQLPVDGVQSKDLKVVSESGGILFVRLMKQGTPARGDEQDGESNLRLSLSYTDADDNAVDPTSLQQGKEFTATVSVMNPGTRGTYKNLALNQIFPSGWEINNLRLDGVEESTAKDVPTYQDIRDDRVYTYFDLAPGQRKTFKVLLTASYTGTYYLPAVSCEAMYDHSVYARKKGQTVQVTRGTTQ
ncbi:MAG TPA: MG2 domain-containing protein [Chryseolinea sp.]|nr:MG2 domain-containing protein [Chryseolinea sp.]